MVVAYLKKLTKEQDSHKNAVLPLINLKQTTQSWLLFNSIHYYLNFKALNLQLDLQLTKKINNIPLSNLKLSEQILPPATLSLAVKFPPKILSKAT